MSITRTKMIALAIAMAFPLAATAQDKAPSIGTPPAGAYGSDTDGTMGNRGAVGNSGAATDGYSGSSEKTQPGNTSSDVRKAPRAKQSSPRPPRDANFQGDAAGNRPGEGTNSKD